jgi:hypothetical protein
MALQMLTVWAKGPPGNKDKEAVRGALQTAQEILKLTLDNWGQVNLEERGPLPNLIGYTEDQDYVDADAAKAQEVARVRDLYLAASHRDISKPVYVLFVVPAGEVVGANGFSIRRGYCSVVPVPTGVPGTADGHTYGHEIAHGLSLKHLNDTQNLMFPFRMLAPDKLSGDELIEEQYIQMRRFLQEYPSLSIS